MSSATTNNPNNKYVSLVESKVVFAPIGEYVTKNGEVKMNFARLGVRIKLDDNSTWFYAFRFRSWSRTLPGLLVRNRALQPHHENGKESFTPPRKESFGSSKQLKMTMGHCRNLLEELVKGVQKALQDEAEKMAQARANKGK